MLKRAVGAAALGNAMEWFDFGVYGYLAVTIGQVFFPSSNPTAQVIAAFATLPWRSWCVRSAALCSARWGIATAARKCWRSP